MIEVVLDRFIALLGPIATLSRDKRELKDNALRAISHALTETHIYYSSLNRGNDRNLETEAQLARYWSAASIPLRHIDPDLAQTCEHKSEYWVSPENFSEEQVKETGIRLTEVKNAYKQLAIPSLSRAARNAHT